MTSEIIKIDATTKIKTTHYYNGKVECKTPYVSDKRHGMEIGWRDDDGTKWWTTPRKDGEKHGVRTQWYQNGAKYLESMWKDGNKHGLQTWCREDGTKRREILFANDKEYARMGWDKEGNVTEIDFPRPSIINPTVKSKKNHINIQVSCYTSKPTAQLQHIQMQKRNRA